MAETILDCFVLVNGNTIISPVLATIRSYGIWFEKTFDEYTCQMQLYMKSKKADGSSVLEYHPGTLLGKFFDAGNFTDEALKSWYIERDCSAMERLVKLHLAEYKDAIPISVNDAQHRQMLRVYTKKQLDTYIRNLLHDRTFSIDIGTPKQIKIKDADLAKLTRPAVTVGRKKLF